MSYVKGVPQNPIVIFWDASEFELVRCTNTIKDGKPALEMVLSPFEWVLSYLSIKESELKFDDSGYGTLTRTYPAAKREVISDNPEKPMWLMLCTFHGTSIHPRSGDMQMLVRTKEELESLQAQNTMLHATIKRLERENFNLSIKNKEFFETQQDMTRPQQPLLPASDQGDLEIKRKINMGNQGQ